MDQHEIDELLEAVWTCAERGEHSADAVRGRCHVPLTPEMLDRLDREGLVACAGDKVLLTRKGKLRATVIVRRHRLAERLLVDLLRMPMNKIETPACEFEHLAGDAVWDGICTLLGHPRECPHGSVIPEGTCCREARLTAENAVIPLSGLCAGASGTIAYMRAGGRERLQKLLSFGFSPGAEIKVIQKKPVYVLGFDHSKIALDPCVIDDIFIWKKVLQELPAGQ